MDSNLALIYGVMLGDGCLSSTGRNSSVVITCDMYTDEPFMNYLKPILVKLRGKDITIYRKQNQGAIEFNFSDKKLFNIIKNLNFPVGKKGKSLCIHTDLLAYMKFIVQGYFATDGCLVITNNNGTIYPRLEFSSISQKLLQQIEEYLRELAIMGNIYVSKKYTNNWNTLYRLQINGRKNLLKFKQKIGFINPKHEQRLLNYFNYYPAGLPFLVHSKV